MKAAYLYGILAANEFLHGFALVFLTLFTAENLFGRRYKKWRIFPLVSGLALSALVSVTVIFRIFGDITLIMAGVFIAAIVLEWLLLTDRKLSSLFVLVCAMIFAESVTSAIGNMVFAAVITTGISGETAMIEMAAYLVIYIVSTLYMQLIWRLSGGNIQEPLPVLYIALISLVVALLSQLAPNERGLNEVPAAVDLSDVMLSSVIMLCISLLIVFVIKTTRSRYLEKINHLNEDYLNIQSRHFETVRRNDTEMRRINHDMRNHIFCMNELCRSGKYDELSQYLEKLSQAVSDAQTKFRTGSGIADAIIEEKSAAARQYNVRFEVSGDLGMIGISAYELCTIFANLLDNAVEAASYFCVKNRVVSVSCKSTDKFIILTISNGTAMKVDTSSQIVTLKTDKKAHGFGLENVRKAVERNGGELILSCEPYSGEFLFTAEVIFPVSG